jgi:hypothetical protein
VRRQPPRAATAANATARRDEQDDGPTEPVAFRGALQIRSVPDGARVFINGVLAGVTPLLLSNVPIGSRALRIELDGYDAWTGLIRVVANQQTMTSVVLHRR